MGGPLGQGEEPGKKKTQRETKDLDINRNHVAAMCDVPKSKRHSEREEPARRSHRDTERSEDTRK